jgi:pilus assembly protein CpaC
MRAVKLIAAAFCAGLLLQAPAASADPADDSAAYSGSIGLPVGGSHILQFDRPVGRIYLGDADTADVIALTDRSVYLLGKEAGTSSLTIMERGQRSTPMARYVVQVGVDALGLRRTLHEVMPHEGIEVRLAGDGLVLSGAASSAAAAERAVSIASRFAADRVVNSMTLAAAEQVMLSVRVSEVRRNELAAMGLRTNIQWADTDDAASLVSGIINPDAFANLTGFFSTGDYTIEAVLDALESRGVVTTLAEPTLVALSGETANFFAGGEFPIPVAVNGSGTDTRITIEFKQFGVAVAFTPTVIGDTINLHVAPEVSALDRNNAIRIFDTEIPALTTRRAQTTVELRDGQSFAIAGLIRRDFRDDIQGIPGAARIPILGALFRSSTFEREESEIVIIVTARRARPTTLDQLITPTDLFNAPSHFQLFWMGQVEGAPVTRRIGAQAQADGADFAGRFDQNVGYVIQ